MIDPFDGKRLRSIVDGERFLVYSIGQNEFDDGGDVEQQNVSDALFQDDLG